MPTRFGLFLVPILITICWASTAWGRSAQHLWVLQQPKTIVEYNLNTFRPSRTMTVPARIVEHPEYLSVNARGQMLFAPPKGAQWAGGEMATAGDRMWFWDGRRSREWGLGGVTKSENTARGVTVTETALQWLLSADGRSLFRFENRFDKIMDDNGLDRSVRSRACVWLTDVAGGRVEKVATLPRSDWCSCGTGTCSETCPEWSLWTPDGVVGDFFLATKMTPGQLGATYHESRIYRRLGQKWISEKLPMPVEMPLTGTRRGEMLVAAVPDGGCCGWENESSDRMLLLQRGSVSTLYDEFSRYENHSYDVSFYPAKARFAPGRDALLAYTIVSSADSGSEIRLSSEGRENDEELARVRKAMRDLPAVEVILLGVKPRTVTTIGNAALVGWLNEREILVAQDGRLAVYDIRGEKRKDTPIMVRSAADAFLR